jgi:hypothetical protein
MKAKLLSTAAAVALLGAASVASAAEPLTDQQMDGITAGTAAAYLELLTSAIGEPALSQAEAQTFAGILGFSSGTFTDGNGTSQPVRRIPLLGATVQAISFTSAGGAAVKPIIPIPLPLPPINGGGETPG